MEISIATDSEKNEWDNFILENLPPEEQFFRLFSWKNFLEEVFNYKPYYLVARKDSKIVACFPFMLIKSILFGNTLISLPFSQNKAGGIIFSKIYTENYKKSLIKKFHEKILEICKSEKIKLVQIRGLKEKSEFFEKLKYEYPFEDFNFVLDIRKSAEEVFNNFDKKLRNIIRKVTNGGISVEIKNSFDGVKILYSIYLDNMKKLGTPPVTINYINKLKFPENFCIMLAKYNEKYIAGISFVKYKNFVLWCDGVYIHEYRALNPITLLLWEAIQHLKKENIEFFDLGTSRADSNNYEFKRKWNPAITNNYKIYYYIGKGKPRDSRAEEFGKLARIWRKFVPGFIARIFGPHLRKAFG